MTVPVAIRWVVPLIDRQRTEAGPDGGAAPGIPRKSPR
jgi:hypothetical protein